MLFYIAIASTTLGWLKSAIDECDRLGPLGYASGQVMRFWFDFAKDSNRRVARFMESSTL